MISKALVTLTYGLWLMANGTLRYVEAQSVPALGFGLTMGVLALVAALLLFKQKRLAAYILTVVVLLFVVGFFVTKSMKEGFQTRVIVTLVASLIEAVVLFLPVRAAQESTGA